MGKAMNYPTSDESFARLHRERPEGRRQPHG
jgi:hypothetical protein